MLLGAETSQLGHQYSDYHDFLAMALSARDRESQDRFFEQSRRIEEASSFVSATIKSIAKESFREFENRYPSYISIFKTDITRGIVHTFNHPTESVLNEIYKVIWAADFGCDIHAFCEFTEDLLAGLTLPVPSFASKAVLTREIGDPWDAKGAISKECSQKVAENYEYKAKLCISLYKDNAQILEWKDGHFKLDAANRFLAELGIWNLP